MILLNLPFNLPEFFKMLMLMMAFTVHYTPASAQVLPREQQEVNYRLIGFAAPPEKKAAGCSLEIALGTFHSEDSFRRNIISTTRSSRERIVAEVPFFNRQYTWRMVYHYGKTTVKTRLYHFSTGYIPEIDTSLTRLRVTVPASKHSDALVFLDGSKVLYDMKGKPIWYLPMIEGQEINARDMKLTDAGTITFLAGNNAYEINYDGDILWKAPNDGSVNCDREEYYHHNFTRLSNGHYMILGMELMQMPVSDTAAGHGDQRIRSTRIRFGTIIEYDHDGHVAWSWKSSKYFTESGIFQTGEGTDPSRFDAHENAFSFDEKEKVIYLSCKGLNTLLKIKYPEGTVINSYGEYPQAGSAKKGKRLFCDQHGVNIGAEACLFIYNNNACNDAPPKIKKLKEPTAGNDSMKITWEYQCTTDGYLMKKFTSGGNVVPLPDYSMLVCMGGEYSKIFVVDENKKILWSALPEKKDNQNWVNLHQYRASIINDRRKLPPLIWASQ